MWHIIEHSILDSLKMLPFLFLAYLIIEYVEQRSSSRITSILTKSDKTGPIGGALLGCFPQCGFSVLAANLYADRLIPIGTFLAVLISTSDEAIPVLLANPGSFLEIWKILITKLVIAILVGVSVNLIYKKRNTVAKEAHAAVLQHKQENHKEELDHCHDAHCGCHHHHGKGILKPALWHTFNIFLFVLIVTLVMNILIELLGEDRLSMVLMSDSIFQPIIASLIGLIPNCAASVVLTELYLAGTVSFGSIIAGLTTSVGLGFVVLFKTNRHIKENLKIIAIVYIIAVFVGVILQLLGV